MRFSGEIRQNFFHEALKANGRAGFSHSPVFDSVPEPGKTSWRTTGAANLKTKKTEKITTNGSRLRLKNRSCLTARLRRLQQLPLQENLCQFVQRIPIPPHHGSQGKLHQVHRLC